MRPSRRLLALPAVSAILIVTAAHVTAQPLRPIGAIAAPADLVALSGRYAYVAAARTLSLVDIADPAAPRPAGRLDLPERIWAMRVSPPLAFLALDLAGLAIVDVSDASAPRLRSVLKLPGQTVGVSSAGTRVLAANLMSGVEYIDVTNPDAPTVIGAFFTEGYARDVAVAGSLAVVVDQPTGFSVLDLGVGGVPEIATGADQSAEAPLMIAVSSDPIAGRRFAAVVNGRGLLMIYDITNPAAPRKTATLATPGRATRAALRGAEVYIADGPAGLQIVSLANPEAPAITFTWPTDGPARDVAVSDGTVVVISGASGQGVATLLR